MGEERDGEREEIESYYIFTREKLLPPDFISCVKLSEFKLDFPQVDHSYATRDEVARRAARWKVASCRLVSLAGI